MFKLSVPKCPWCGEPAEGTVDDVPCIARFIEVDLEGRVDYGGDSRMCWDGQMSRTNPEKPDEVMVQCHMAHEWYTLMPEIEDISDADSDSDECFEDCAVHTPECDGNCDHGLAGPHINGCWPGGNMPEAVPLQFVPSSVALLSDKIMDTLVESNPELMGKIEAAVRRADLRRNNKTCPRCADSGKVTPCSGASAAPEMCHDCIDAVVELQEKAYGEGWAANKGEKRPRANPYRHSKDPEDGNRANHWDSGWQDADETDDPDDDRQ